MDVPNSKKYQPLNCDMQRSAKDWPESQNWQRFSGVGKRWIWHPKTVNELTLSCVTELQAKPLKLLTFWGLQFPKFVLSSLKSSCITDKENSEEQLEWWVGKWNTVKSQQQHDFIRSSTHSRKPIKFPLRNNKQILIQ